MAQSLTPDYKNYTSRVKKETRGRIARDAAAMKREGKYNRDYARMVGRSDPGRAEAARADARFETDLSRKETRSLSGSRKKSRRSGRRKGRRYKSGRGGRRN